MGGKEVKTFKPDGLIRVPHILLWLKDCDILDCLQNMAVVFGTQSELIVFIIYYIIRIKFLEKTHCTMQHQSKSCQNLNALKWMLKMIFYACWHV